MDTVWGVYENERSLMKEKRMIIYTKDIQRITGKTDRSARKILRKVRIALGKSQAQMISVEEFCAFMGLDKEEVLRYIE